MEDKLLTTAAVAKMLSLTYATVFRMYQGGRLKGLKIGPRSLRFRESDIRDFLKNAEVETAGAKVERAAAVAGDGGL